MYLYNDPVVQRDLVEERHRDLRRAAQVSRLNREARRRRLREHHRSP